ncbi:hypothetical protein B0I35DRAFT_476915 [Stachybotrys elegans]|uniref:Uncharacterized protein n=1 Tax=Stachybotrys elegans TaxID=80388 RepID=A0A8K0SS75_9HYPO|nr:hypothetical protein B0I35DRAFT_476915 [Stachybotrys elegans]
MHIKTLVFAALAAVYTVNASDTPRVDVLIRHIITIRERPFTALRGGGGGGGRGGSSGGRRGGSRNDDDDDDGFQRSPARPVPARPVPVGSHRGGSEEDQRRCRSASQRYENYMNNPPTQSPEEAELLNGVEEYISDNDVVLNDVIADCGMFRVRGPLAEPFSSAWSANFEAFTRSAEPLLRSAISACKSNSGFEQRLRTLGVCTDFVASVTRQAAARRTGSSSDRDSGAASRGAGMAMAAVVGVAAVGFLLL